MTWKFWKWHFCRCVTQSDDTGCWGECIVCHKRFGFVSRADLRAYADKEIDRVLETVMGVERQIPSDLAERYHYLLSVRHGHKDHVYPPTFNFEIALIERIGDHAAEVAELKVSLKEMTEIAEHCAPVPGHEGSCGPESMCDAQCMDAAHCGQAIRKAQRLFERTDQQLQPTQDMLPNSNRQGTPHEHAHERTLACSAPPKCQRRGWLPQVRARWKKWRRK